MNRSFIAVVGAMVAIPGTVAAQAITGVGTGAHEAKPHRPGDGRIGSSAGRAPKSFETERRDKKEAA